MVTKYTTGQAVLIPATIRSAEEINGQIIYHVDVDTWEGSPEAAVVINESAQVQSAMETFRRALTENAERPWR